MFSISTLDIELSRCGQEIRAALPESPQWNPRQYQRFHCGLNDSLSEVFLGLRHVLPAAVASQTTTALKFHPAAERLRLDKRKAEDQESEAIKKAKKLAEEEAEAEGEEEEGEEEDEDDLDGEDGEGEEDDDLDGTIFILYFDSRFPFV